MQLNLRPYRDRRGWTTYEVADRLGVSQPSYTNWENGKAMPTADKLPALATLFGCTIDALYTGAQDPPDVAILPRKGGENHGA